MIIEISFKGNRREFFEWPFEDTPTAKTAVVVEVERGEDFGYVHATGELALKRKAGTTHGKASSNPLRKAIRAASGDEVAKAKALREDEVNVRTRAIEKVRALGLDLKISDTEWQWDKKRLAIYFTAEQRVDFRQLVRQLEGLFGTRVHMWHIGVRDEAKRVDGVGRCGRQFCSANWLPELNPVKSSVAKDQHLSTLNPAQISGACGRLMCCLRYEHEFYVQQRKRFPKEGKIITTAAGEEKVISLDIFRETVTLRSPVGESRVVPLVQLRQEMRGEPVTVPESPDDAGALDGADEEMATVAMPASKPFPPRPPQEERPQEGRPQPRGRQQRPPQDRPRQEKPPQDGPRKQRPQRQRPSPQQPRDARPTQALTQAAVQTPVQDAGSQQAAQSADGQPQGPNAGDGESGHGRRRRRGRRGGRRGGGGSGGGENRGPNDNPGSGGNPANHTPPAGGPA